MIYVIHDAMLILILRTYTQLLLIRIHIYFGSMFGTGYMFHVCMYVCKDSAAPAHARTRAHIFRYTNDRDKSQYLDTHMIKISRIYSTFSLIIFENDLYFDTVTVG